MLKALITAAALFAGSVTGAVHAQPVVPPTGDPSEYIERVAFSEPIPGFRCRAVSLGDGTWYTEAQWVRGSTAFDRLPYEDEVLGEWFPADRGTLIAFDVVEYFGIPWIATAILITEDGCDY